jgi:peptidoglycan/LPS O-acetylase OafA/YrhL
MRVIRLLFAGFAFVWLCLALLRLYTSFSHPDSTAREIGHALVPLCLFLVLVFAGGRAKPKSDLEK